MLLDQVDAMLAENDMTVPIDIYVGSRTIDLRSIDKATTSITHFGRGHGRTLLLHSELRRH